MATRTYIGPLAKGRVTLLGRTVDVVAGEPFEVSTAESKLLTGDSWDTPKATRKPRKRRTTKPTPPTEEGSEPTTKEPKP